MVSKPKCQAPRERAPQSPSAQSDLPLSEETAGFALGFTCRRRERRIGLRDRLFSGENPPPPHRLFP